MKQPKMKRGGEIWMLVKDPKKIARIMVIQEISHRQMADALGWKSHSYLGRILRGEVRSVDVDAAVKIAAILGVPLDDLFVTKMSTQTGQIGEAA